MQSLAASLERLAASKRHLAPVVLRIALGAVFLAHAYAKIAIFTLPGTAGFFRAHGIPGWMAYPVLAIELIGGLCLIAGVRVRWVAAALIPVMLGALIPHVANGWMFTNPGGGWEYVAFLIAALIAQVLLGGGEDTVAPTHTAQSRA